MRKIEVVKPEETCSRSHPVFRWHPLEPTLAIGGTHRNAVVKIIRGETSMQVIPPKQGPIIALEWSCFGTYLALLQANSDQILLYNVKLKTSVVLRMDVREITLIRWADHSERLAIGTARGDVVFYFPKSKNRQFVDNKHRKRVTCGTWSGDGKFAFASDEKAITIAREDGKIFAHFKVKFKVVSLHFNRLLSRQPLLCASLENKTLLLYKLQDAETCIELQFCPKYGPIVLYELFGWDHLIVGFRSGTIVLVSTPNSDDGNYENMENEVYNCRLHEEELTDMSFTHVVNKLATCGGQTVKIVNCDDWTVESELQLDVDVGQPAQLCWCCDGQYLAVSTSDGYLFMYEVELHSLEHFYLSKLPNCSTLVSLPIQRSFAFLYILLAFTCCFSASSLLFETSLHQFFRACIGDIPLI